MMTGVASIALAQHYIYTSTSTTSNLTYFLFGNTPIYLSIALASTSSALYLHLH